MINYKEKLNAPRIMMQKRVDDYNVPPLPVWIDDVIEYCKGAEIHEIVKTVREADARGDTETKRKEKLKAAVVLPNACMMGNDGRRKKENAMPGGVNGVDLDDIENPREIYARHISGREEALGIIWVHRTISGKGLHIFFARKRDETIKEGQKRIVESLGLCEYYDAKCTDGSRAFFLSEWEDTYYINKEAFLVENTEENVEMLNHFWEIDKKETEREEKDIKTPHTNKMENIKIKNKNMSNLKNSSVAYSATQTWSANYRGIEYKTIIDSYLRCLNEEGQIKEGDRNDTYFKLCCGLKFVLPQADGLFAVLPDCGLGAAERWSCIRSAIGYGFDESKMPKSFRLVLQSLSIAEKKKEIEEVWDEETVSGTIFSRPEYALPEQMRLVLNHLPDRFLEPVVFSVLPAYGALATGIRFKYNGETQSFSFFSLCVGDPSSGKGKVMNAVEAVIIPFRENDRSFNKARKKYKKDLKEYRKTGTGAVPEQPEGCQRVVSTNISRGRLLECIDEAEGKHILQVSTEFREYIDNFRKDYGPQVQLYNHAFHNEYDGSDFMSEDAFSGNVKVYFNGTYTGTKDCLYWLIQNSHTGIDTRWLLSELPKEFAQEHLEVEEYTEEELTRIADISRQLTGKGGYIYCPWIDTAAKAWREKQRQICLETGSRSIDYFMNRDTVYFVRIGYMLSLLYGCELHSPLDQHINSDKEKAATEWARYFTDYLLSQQLKFMGGGIESRQEPNYKAPKMANIYNVLPEEFTTTEFRDVCRKIGSSYESNSNKLLGAWVKNGCCIKLGQGKYRKNA